MCYIKLRKSRRYKKLRDEYSARNPSEVMQNVRKALNEVTTGLYWSIKRNYFKKFFKILKQAFIFNKISEYLVESVRNLVKKVEQEKIVSELIRDLYIDIEITEIVDIVLERFPDLPAEMYDLR